MNTKTEKIKRNELLSRKQVAQLLGVDPKTLDKHVRQGEFPTPARILGRPRWDAGVVKSFIDDKLRVVGQV